LLDLLLLPGAGGAQHLTRLMGRAKATGTSVKVPFVHIWRMRGGKVYRGQALTDTAVVADALAGSKAAGTAWGVP
jgi:ketosteroid isomerase-like protein